jgi:phosphonate transport system substrate-binding protein
MRRRAFLASLVLAALPIRAAHSANAQPAIFVVHPYDTPSRLYARFRPLTLYLGGVLGRPMRLIIAATYDEQIEMIASGRADFAYLGPTPYVRARALSKVEILAGETEAGQAFYQSALVVRSDSPIQQVADLAGKRVAFGAEISMSSAVAPKQMLAQAGLARADLAVVAHLDRHERVALAVLHGDFDAGGLRLDIAKAYAPRGLRILAVSMPLPPHIIAASPKVTAEDAQKVRLALLHPDASGQDAMHALGPQAGFTVIEDAHFQAIRRMERALRNW